MSTPAEHEYARDRELLSTTKNTARFFAENRHIAWVLLFATVAWGIYGYWRMPKAKDPTIELRIAAVWCVWPGVDAARVENLVTKKIEDRLAQSPAIERLESISRTGVSIVYVILRDELEDRAKEWDAIQGRLEQIHDLPAGAGPVQFERDFGDTATLMLTVASPKVDDVEIDLRARTIEREITATRATAKSGERATLVVCFGAGVNGQLMRRTGTRIRDFFAARLQDVRVIEQPGFFAIDAQTAADDATLRHYVSVFAEDEMHVSELHPDVWPVAIVREPASTRAALAAAGADRYSYRALDDATDQIQRALARLPIVSRVTRTGVLAERIFLDYSQEKLAQYQVTAGQLGPLIESHNTAHSGGVFEQDGKQVSIDPTGELSAVEQIGDIIVGKSQAGAPVYLRDLVEVERGYATPPTFANHLVRRLPDGTFTRSRAITLAVTMQRGAQISAFDSAVNHELAILERVLPDGLILARTSDQPKQVSENVSLFTRSLVEAIVLVILVALIGFREWRTACLLVLSIPITLAMTFGMMHLAGIDLQQISIASLIVALGLLVDDPVVATDAIKHSMSQGWPARVSAWLGPTKLASAILFATITNIAAYLPFLTLSGDVGIFIHSLPIVLTLSLVASRIVSMTFVPLLAAIVLRRPQSQTQRRQPDERGRMGRVHDQIVGWAIDHRFVVAAIAALLLAAGGAVAWRGTKLAFFPKDASYLFYVDVWLPEDASLAATRSKAIEVEGIVEAATAAWGKQQDRKEPVLRTITEFDGGGGPRFWFSVSPELAQLNYAQLVIEVERKEDTRQLVPVLQAALSKQVADARVDVRELETGEPVGIPISYRLTGENPDQLRTYAERLQAILRATPGAERIRDDWGADSLVVKLDVNADRANLASVTTRDVALSSAAAIDGAPVGMFRDRDREIPIVVRLRADERTQLGDLKNLYVLSENGTPKVPLGQISKLGYALQPEKLRRRNQQHTITVSAFPAAGVLPTQVYSAAAEQVETLRRQMTLGYRLEVGGELEELTKNFKNMFVVFGLMMAAIYLALVLQFRHAIKPVLVFATLPFGSAAALVALVVMKAPLTFMALLGVISLMGVIVSHIVVLFDSVEELHEQGADLREALLSSGRLRLRPVLITVIATVLGLVPLAVHGGPLWEPLCYAQIGGLAIATLLTLVLVPAFYTIAIRDLRIIKWHDAPHGGYKRHGDARMSERPTMLVMDKHKPPRR